MVNLAPRFSPLPDGSQIVTRPITPDDAPWLVRGLRRLSPEGNAYRFLNFRKRFTEDELRYLTRCDFVDHIGLVCGPVNAAGEQVDGVGVARCIRTPEDAGLAEVAIVFVDEWQRRGAGTALLAHLAELAGQAGIRRWRALMLDGNVAAERLFRRFGREVARARPGYGMSEVTFALNG